jgi:1-acyl-sn-glycerol-3-phosphate acyltransferase
MQEWFFWFWYEFFYHLHCLLLTLGFSLRAEGMRHIPPRGPVLILANHQSFFDPMVLGCITHRHVSFLARKTLFHPPWFGWLIRSLNAFPVDQEGVAKDGIRTVLQLLAKGQVVIVFPEGTRTEDGKMAPLKPGVQLLLKRAPVPVVPVGIAGAFEAMPYWEKVPKLCPLWLPATRSAMAAVVGPPLDGRRLGELSREQLLGELTTALQKVQQRAEQLRRKPG